MRQPESLYDQFIGKAMAELHRGSGIWPVQSYAVDLEPPFDEFYRRSVTTWDCYLNHWEGPFKTGFLGRRTRSRIVRRGTEPLVLEPTTTADDADQLVPVSIATFNEDESTIDKAEQFLRSLPPLHRPASFEIAGIGEQPQYDYESVRDIMAARATGDLSRDIDDAISGWDSPHTSVRFIVDHCDAKPIRSQLQAHYPNSAVVIETQLADHDRYVADDLRYGGHAATLYLKTGHCFALKSFSRLDPDPLGVPIAAFEHLARRDWARLQILFMPARYDWARLAREALADPYKPEKWLVNDLDERTYNEKFSSPLFAVGIRVMAHRKYVFDQLLGWAHQFSQPPQSLDICGDDTIENLATAVDRRTTFRPGMLLNVRELAGLVHVPVTNIGSDRLLVVASRTRRAPQIRREAGDMLLGYNTHQGITREARVPAALRPRHLYIAGASGVGKSTLLLNLIVNDINAGRGVACLDPHGDLIQDVLARIPARRVPQTILFDPTDTAFPPSLNILDAKDPAERDRLVSEVVETLKRFSTTPWGARFEYIFRAALATIIRFRKCTLWDVRRILLDAAFRHRCVSRIMDANLQQFWQLEFPKMPKGSADPILNRLQKFLMAENVRNILCQRETLLDFDDIINNRKIFLCNLSSGLLTREISGVLGTFLIAKLLSATFRRAAIPREKRIPIQLVVDEFQAFMGDQLSLGFENILSEARKFHCSLALANQYIDQLSREVRSAVFGNVGVLVCFRLGVKDAHLVGDEFGAYSTQELMSLEVGQAICRTGGAQTAFNLATLPPPARHQPDLTNIIRARSRRYYARPKHQVDAQFIMSAQPLDQSQAASIKSQRTAQRRQAPAETALADAWDIWSDFVM
jgi:hypothetical protein